MTFPGPEFDPPSTPPRRGDASKKVPAGVCGILLGAIGVHKFVLGYTAQGLIMLLTTLFTCGFAGIIWGIIGLIEGIIYLTKSDDEFVATYVVGKKGWF
jgi:TM2 domain-containing membrane protein YozV